YTIGYGGVIQAVLVMIDHKNLSGAQEAGTGRRHQPHWPRAVNNYRTTQFKAGIYCCLIAGGKNIGEKQNPFIIQSCGDFKRANICLGNTHIFSLTAGNAAIKVTETK